MKKPKFKELDLVVLEKDVPEHGLERGDLGTIVLVHSEDAFEVEFVTVGGYTRAVLTLRREDFRPTNPDDLLTTRRPRAA